MFSEHNSDFQLLRSQSRGSLWNSISLQSSRMQNRNMHPRKKGAMGSNPSSPTYQHVTLSNSLNSSQGQIPHHQIEIQQWFINCWLQWDDTKPVLSQCWACRKCSKIYCYYCYPSLLITALLKLSGLEFLYTFRNCWGHPKLLLRRVFYWYV